MSSSASVTPAQSLSSQAVPTTTPAPVVQQPDILPSATTLLQASKLAIQMDCPIQLDYYVDSTTGKAFIGEDNESKDKVLVKSKDEFTSLIQKFYKVGNDFLILTENSIYIISGKVQKKRITLPNSDVHIDT